MRKRNGGERLESNTTEFRDFRVGGKANWKDTPAEVLFTQPAFGYGKGPFDILSIKVLPNFNPKNTYLRETVMLTIRTPKGNKEISADYFLAVWHKNKFKVSYTKPNVISPKGVINLLDNPSACHCEEFDDDEAILYCIIKKRLPRSFQSLAMTQQPMSKKFLLTQEGLEKLNEELKNLINVKRKEVIERIREAASHGDLSENADYAQAREEQSFIEGRILEIEEMVKNAQIISTTGHGNTVSIGSTVYIKVNGQERKYTIVGSNEANPKENKISNESLVGKALLGRKVKEQFKIQTPAGEMEYEIVSIE